MAVAKLPGRQPNTHLEDNMLTVRATRNNAGTLESRLNQFFNDAFGAFDLPYGDSASATWTPAVDIAEHARDRVGGRERARRSVGEEVAQLVAKHAE